eukprot:1159539-Pelagomonas_calceolata.AAC.8
MRTSRSVQALAALYKAERTFGSTHDGCDALCLLAQTDTAGHAQAADCASSGSSLTRQAFVLHREYGRGCCASEWQQQLPLSCIESVAEAAVFQSDSGSCGFRVAAGTVHRWQRLLCVREAACAVLKSGSCYCDQE